MNKGFRQVALIILIGLIVLTIFRMNQDTDEPPFIDYSTFMEKVKSGDIKSVVVEGETKIYGFYVKEDKPEPAPEKVEKETPHPLLAPREKEKQHDFWTIIPYNDPDLVKTLMSYDIRVEGKEVDENLFLRGLVSFLPWLLFFAIIWFLIFRQMQGAGNKALSFGKSKAKLNPETNNKETFKDVAGIDEAKEELSEIVDFLKDPKKFINIGARIPTGVLLTGPPGTGKTLLARAIAGEAGVPFFSISGSDFVEMFVGVGASRVRDLFEQGKKNAPCIIFIDEIDAVGRLRGAGLGGGHDEREQTLNQLLVEMDGFEVNEGVIIIAATNRTDVLDPALLRPGRFDRQIMVDTPDVKGREKILAVHSGKIPLSREVDLKVIAKGTPGFTGADLANLVNESALLAARKNKKRVGMEELESAKDKVIMGPERRSMLISDSEKEVIAYHEAGHTLISMLTSSDPIHKVTIIPRGRALGITMQLPEEEKHIHPSHYWLRQIKMLFGGYVAEKIKYNDTSTGSSNDLERASGIARKMVCEWGMSPKLGAVAYSKRNDQVFLGRDISQQKDFSEKTAQDIDDEIKRIVTECQEEAEKLIRDNIDKFEAIALGLIERESLDNEELNILLDGGTLPPMQNNNSGSGKTNASKTRKSSVSKNKKTEDTFEKTVRAEEIQKRDVANEENSDKADDDPGRTSG